jgi:hypothetical protein
MTTLQKAAKEPDCHSRERVPGMGRLAMSGDGANPVFSGD